MTKVIFCGIIFTTFGFLYRLAVRSLFRNLKEVLYAAGGLGNHWLRKKKRGELVVTRPYYWDNETEPTDETPDITTTEVTDVTEAAWAVHGFKVT